MPFARPRASGPLRALCLFGLGLSLSLGPAGCAARRGASTAQVMAGDRREPADMEALVRQLASAPLDTPMPFDPGVISGTLPNGVRYFIEPNAVPPRRADLRLVVDAGSVLEDDDQRGVAHFVEHMAFNGTRRFSGTELVRWLESIGLAFGSHINAQTGFDTTSYLLRVPTTDPGVLDTAVDVLRDWTDGVLFDPAEFEKERGVVLEEWRTGRGADSRGREAVLPLLLYKSRYAERDPIGGEASIQALSIDAAKRFYADWYRADNIAVIAVGDFDPVAMQAAIIGAFGDLPKPEGARPRERFPVPDHEELLVSVVPDPETTHSVISVQIKVDDLEEDTLKHYRDSVLISNLAFLMLNERLNVRSQAPDAPWLGAGIQPDRVTATRSIVGVGAAVPEGGVERGLEQLLVELERARRFGFTEGELERAKLFFARNMDRYYKERRTTDSGTHAEELSRHVTTGEPVPGIPYEFALAAALLPQIGAEDVRSWLSGALPERSRVILASVPAKAGVAPPTEASLRAAAARVATMELSPPAPELALPPLIAVVPAPGSITARRELPELGVTEWTLSNGLQLWLKPTRFKADQVLLHVNVDAGTTAFSPDDTVSVNMALDVVERSGLGELDPVGLGRSLAGAELSISPYMGDARSGVVGGSSAEPRDLERLFQLVYLQASGARFTAEGAAAAKRLRASALENRLASPEGKMSDAWNKLIWADEPRTRPWEVETLEQLNPAAAASAYRAVFGSLGAGRGVIVGSFTLDEIEPLVLRYLATLPASPPPPVVAPMPLPLTGRRAQVIYAGTEPTAQVQHRLDGAWDGGQQQRHLIGSVATGLDLVLREALREQLGGTYGVSVDPHFEEEPSPRWSISVGFQCDPARAEELKAALVVALDKVRAEGFSEEVSGRVLAGQRGQAELVRTSNLWWRDSLNAALRQGKGPEAVFEQLQAADWTTPEALRATAAQVLATPDVATLTLLPEAMRP